MMVDASADMLIDIERMDRENPEIRYLNIVDQLPRLRSYGLSDKEIEADMSITLRPEHRLPMTAATLER